MLSHLSSHLQAVQWLQVFCWGGLLWVTSHPHHSKQSHPVSSVVQWVGLWWSLTLVCHWLSIWDEWPSVYAPQERCHTTHPFADHLGGNLSQSFHSACIQSHIPLSYKYSSILFQHCLWRHFLLEIMIINFQFSQFHITNIIDIFMSSGRERDKTKFLLVFPECAPENESLRHSSCHWAHRMDQADLLPRRTFSVWSYIIKSHCTEPIFLFFFSFFQKGLPVAQMA